VCAQVATTSQGTAQSSFFIMWGQRKVLGTKR
jgi:hypothetical protein